MLPSLLTTTVACDASTLKLMTRKCVSVNQMTSTKLGFVAQLKGKLTKKRYRCATVFVDHYSCLRCVHPQDDDSSIETVTAKHAFKTFAAQHGVRIQHYHCDKGVSTTTPSNRHATMPASSLPSVA